MALFKTRKQNFMALTLFAVIYLLFDRTEFFINQFPANFDPPKSAAQISEGDLYGTCAPIEQLQGLNQGIYPVLRLLKQTPFFRTYKINLERECPFWAQQRLCNSHRCAVCECPENEVPSFWKETIAMQQPENFEHKVVSSSEPFSSVFQDNIFNAGALIEKKVIDCPQNDKEWCVEDQDGTYEEVNESDYMLVNLLENEESFTAYQGAPIWGAIYAENCLLDKVFTDLKHRVNQDKYKLLDSAEECTEATLLYHLMSGLHTSVNTHISNGFEDAKTGELVSNQTYFLDTVGNHPDRVKNLHFIYAAVVKAVSLMEFTLEENQYETGLSVESDMATKKLVQELLRRINASNCDEPFKEKNFFQSMEADAAEMELLSEIQHKFYNISRVMDCISCDKCRLNGKVQVRGLATTLKVLFLPQSQQSEILNQISNQEIVSVIQLLIKLSESLKILQQYAIKEREFGLEVWMCQMVAQFASAFLLTVLAMFLFGFSVKDLLVDDVPALTKITDPAEGGPAKALEEGANKAEPQPTSQKPKGKKNRREKID